MTYRYVQEYFIKPSQVYIKPPQELERALINAGVEICAFRPPERGENFLSILGDIESYILGDWDAGPRFIVRPIDRKRSIADFWE